MSQKKRVDRPFAAVVALVLVGTVVAFFDGNWGIAREVDRQIIQFFILSMITLTFVNTEERIRTLFKFFFWYFIFFAVWGVVGLQLTPIEAGSDPGTRAIVPWHPWLDNRDGFGPLMVIGMAFSFYLIQAVGSWKAKTAAFLGMWLCLIGIVMSFGRGVFLAMLATAVFIWLQMKQKLIGAVVIGVIVLLGAAAVMIVSPGDLYWEKMGTIESSMSEGTGRTGGALGLGLAGVPR